MSRIRKQIASDIKDSYMGYGDFRDYIAVDLLDESFRKLNLSFSVFCARNFIFVNGDIWISSDIPKEYTTEELYNMFIENYERNTAQ